MIALEKPRVGYRWVVLAALGVVWLVIALDRMSVTAVLPLIRAELGIGHDAAGLIGSIYLLSYSLAQFPAGFLADRIGPKATMRVAMVALVGTAFTGMVGGYAHLLVVRILVAFGVGHQWAAGVRAYGSWFPTAERGRALSLIMNAGIVGFAIAPLLAGLTIALVGSWRAVYWWVPALGLLAAVALQHLFYDTPNQAIAAGRMGDDELRHIRAGIAPTPARGNSSMLRLVLHDPMLWVYSAVAFGNSAVYYGVMVWIASFLYEQHSLGVATSSVITAVPYVVGFGAMLLGGWLVDRRNAARLTIIVSFVALIPVLFFIAVAPADVPLLVALFALLGLFCNLPFVPIFSYQMRRYPKEILGSATGIGHGLGTLGSFIAPLVAGYLVVPQAGGYSFQGVFVLLIVVCVLSAGVAAFLNEKPFRPHGYDAG